MNSAELFDFASSLARAQSTAVQAGAVIGSRSALTERRQDALDTGNALLAMARQLDDLARQHFDRAQRIGEQLETVK